MDKVVNLAGVVVENKRNLFLCCASITKNLIFRKAFPGVATYLEVLKQESASIIKKVRKQPCLALWCGGNELLNAQCLIMDPGTPYIPSSPIEGVAHGAYVFRDTDGEEVFQRMIRINKQRQKYTAYPEFGVPAPSSVQVLRTIIPGKELWPPKPGGAWETHHGFRAWGGDSTSWLMMGQIEYYFGKP